MKQKIGIAFGGGGARGSYQVGVIDALNQAGLLKQIKFVSGTSIGAINAVLVMAGLTQHEIREFWDEIDNDELFGNGLSRFKKDKSGLFSTKALFDKLSSSISEKRVKKSKIQGYATAAKLQKKYTMLAQLKTAQMEKVVFHLNKMESPYMGALASASIPVLFGPTEIDGGIYVDGGMVDKVPVDPLIEAGCKLIFVVPLNGGFFKEHYEDTKISFANIESKYVFSQIPLLGKLDMIKFKPDDVERKARYGFLMTNLILQKLRDAKILVGKKIKNLKKFNSFEITDEEEVIIREEIHKEMKEENDKPN